MWGNACGRHKGAFKVRRASLRAQPRKSKPSARTESEVESKKLESKLLRSRLTLPGLAVTKKSNEDCGEGRGGRNPGTQSVGTEVSDPLWKPLWRTQKPN